MTDRVRWGIIGAGAIAQTFAAGVAASNTGTMLAIGSRDQSTADHFGEKYGVPRRYGTYAAVLADPDIDAVYVATPHPFHAEWAIHAADAGKHLLIEKPLGINHAEAMAVIEAARRNDVFLMEGFMYRCHPQTAKLVELIRSRVIGAVRVIEASFGFRIGNVPEHRLLRQELAGGGILDVGGYPVSMARLIAGVAMGGTFANPVEVHGSGHLGSETRVDEWTAATLKFDDGIIAQVMTAIRVSAENVVRIFGDEGSILVPAPWTLRGSSLTSSIIVKRTDESEPREIVVEAPADPWAIEADTVGHAIQSRQATFPAMSWEDTLGNMQTLDRWRESIGLVYDSERLQSPVRRLTSQSRIARTEPTMTYGTIAGIDKPVSRLIMGVDNQKTLPHAAVMFDDFIDRGGNCFDVAYVYGNGLSEQLLGRWIEERGIRDEVVLLGKGAHTPHCNPEAVTTQLETSLDRLRTDRLDIYMLHRDNPAVPVGEFIDVLNEQQHAGRIGIFGGSNWSIERLEAANAYARDNGLQGFSAVSNNFSLARMIAPPWAGCISSGGQEWRNWLTRTQTPLLPWSSQARGFFTGRAAPEKLTDEELVRCWYSEDNFARLARVKTMAAERGVQPISIALAWVLQQPFPTFPLIGPRTLEETRTSMPGVAITLTEAEVAWLNLESDER